ncbi:MAG: GNAT family N-acetyltransferase; N-acetyltransferase [Spirosomataceae bacterium]
MKVDRKYEKYGISLKLVEIQDAEFILELRTNDEQRAKYLSQTEKDVEKQREWIRKYKEREALGYDYYFIAVDEYDRRLGTVRIYDIGKEVFTSGSWIFFKKAPVDVAMKAFFIVLDIGFNELKLQKCAFEIHKENKGLLKYQSRFRASKEYEEADFLYFTISYRQYSIQRDNILNILEKRKNIND